MAYVPTIRYTSCSDTRTIWNRVGLLFTHDNGDFIWARFLHRMERSSVNLILKGDRHI